MLCDVGAQISTGSVAASEGFLADSVLQALRKAFFFALIGVANLGELVGLMTLARLPKRMPKSWMIVAAADCDVQICNLIHRDGGDACVAPPSSPEDVIDRPDEFQIRARPSL